MAKMRAKRFTTTPPRWAGVALLAMLSVIAVAMVATALTQSRAVSPNAGTAPAAAKPKIEQPAATDEPPAEPVVATVQSPIMQRLLTVSPDGGLMLRAAVGGCPEPAGAIEYSTDAGASWQVSSLANAGGATQLLQLDVSDASTEHFVALGEGCAVVGARSFIDGVDWEPADAAGLWYIDPNDSTVVHGPAGAASVGCEAVGLSSFGERAITLCLDSSVVVSGDAGVTWSAPVAVPNGAAVGTTPTGFVVASVAEAECAGVRTRSFDGVNLGEAGACVDVADTGGGNVAVVGDSLNLYLWAGGAFLRSPDSGGTWS